MAAIAEASTNSRAYQSGMPMDATTTMNEAAAASAPHRRPRGAGRSTGASSLRNAFQSSVARAGKSRSAGVKGSRADATSVTGVRKKTFPIDKRMSLQGRSPELAASEGGLV